MTHAGRIEFDKTYIKHYNHYIIIIIIYYYVFKSIKEQFFQSIYNVILPGSICKIYIFLWNHLTDTGNPVCPASLLFLTSS